MISSVSTEHGDDLTVAPALRFLSLLLLAEVLLIAASWPLWTTIDQFPAVPLLAAFCAAPVVIDQGCTVVLCVSAIVGCMAIVRELAKCRSVVSTEISRRRPPSDKNGKFVAPCLLLSLLCGCLLAVLNQHRLQPWHWLFLLITLQALLLRGAARLALFRLTLASIYVFAAASRWGPDVDSGMSRQVLSVLLKAINGESLLRNSSFVLGGCVAMTVVEFLTGVLLLTCRFRRVGIATAIAMHATLIFALSPWGLNHHFGVLVWNAFLLLAVPVLFAGACQNRELQNGFTTTKAKILAAFVVLFPLSGLFAVADNWLSWQVYSPRPEVVRIYIHEEFTDVLPSELRPFVGQPAPLDVWCPVRIDQWSLQATSVPLYPEDRFQLAIAGRLIEIVDDPNAIKILIDEPHQQPWRKRRTQTIDRAALGDRVSQFLFNGNCVRKPFTRTRIAER